MYGVHDLLLHIMYVNHRENLNPIKCVLADKVTFLALAYCYKNGHHIQYDYMFRKSKYGASGHNELIKYKYKNFDRTLLLEYGKPIKELEEDKDLDETIVKLINIANSDPYTLPKFIMGSIFYQIDVEEIEKIAEESSFTDLFPYWLKYEIVNFFDKDGNLNNELKVHSEIDSRIPLDEETYQVMNRFLQYGSYSKQKMAFTRSELMIFHSLPYHAIRSIEKNGCYHEPKLDKK